MIEAINQELKYLKQEIEWLEFSIKWEDEVLAELKDNSSLMIRCRRMENQNNFLKLNYLKLKLREIKSNREQQTPNIR
jgi:hypothetical protein